MRNLVKQSWLSVLSGMLFGLAWEPFGWWPLAFVAWAAWYTGLIGKSREALFIHSLLFSITSWLIPFHWVMLHPVSEAAMSSGVALFTFSTLFAACTSLVVSWLPLHAGRLRIAGGLVAALSFDVLLHYGPVAMPWLSVGFSVSPSPWSLGAGALLGVEGSSLLLLTCAALLSHAVPDPTSQPRSRLVSLVLALCLFALPLLRAPQPVSGDHEHLIIRMLEPSMTPHEWADVNERTKVEAFISALSAPAVPAMQAALTVLPETALPMAPPDSLHAWVDRLAAVARSPVVSGGIEWTAEDASGGAFNVVYSSEEGERRYAKRRLVPFGEHVPFSDWIPFFDRFSVPSGGVSSYQRGTTQDVLSAGPIRVAPLICFESLFLRDARSALKAGASLLVVTTQDGWWGSDLPRRQHLAFSRMLAASTGHPVVHATVDGESGLIASDGRLVPLSRTRPLVLEGSLPLQSTKTVYMSVGNRPFFGIFAALVTAFLIAVRRTRNVATSVQKLA